jgi:hypothetical protein
MANCAGRVYGEKIDIALDKLEEAAVNLGSRPGSERS